MYCYRCGRFIESSQPHLRRRVPVGEWLRKSYGRGTSSSVVQKHGMRIVCRSCAHWIDQLPVRNAIRQWVQIAVLLVILALSLVSSLTRVM